MKSELELELTKFVENTKDKENYVFCTNRKLSLEEVREVLEFIKNCKQGGLNMNNFEKVVLADKMRKVADKQINERKAILEKEGWVVNLVEATNEMLYNVADEESKKRYIVSMNVKTGKTIVEIRRYLKENIKFEFNADVKLITIFGYDDLIREIGKEIEKYDI